MSVKDNVKGEHEKLKNLPFKKKIEYILDYYKFPIIGIIIALIALVSIAKGCRQNAKPSFLDALVINSYLPYASADYLENDYIKYAGIDLDAYRLSINTDMIINPESIDQISIANTEKLMVMYASESLDVVIATEDIVTKYGTLGAHMDLSRILGSDYCDRLWEAGFEPFYCQIVDEAKSSDGKVSEPKSEPYLAGIYIDSAEYFKNLGDYGAFSSGTGSKNRPIFTISINAKNIDHSILFLQMITGVN